MDWPTCSPDLNAIECIWDIMSRSIHQCHVAHQTLQELTDALIQVCEEIPQENIRRLIRMYIGVDTMHLSMLMVAEKTGIIRIYDLSRHQAILSLESLQTPLMSADWCLQNTFRVGAVAANDWIFWEMPHSSCPQATKPVHSDRARCFKWSKCNENIFATTGCPGKMNTQLLIHHLEHPLPILIGSAPVSSGLSWHRSLPLCVVGGYRKLFFWLTEM
ncbi:unnamed protein product [Ranitomeya imitator]|uniref:Uncharacterized protein n=1 Tax=Ranitomeya imitator TaxID=111125 RepID=A0ABN9LE17_9NEOB|nr:unnamed protein product [Ranitomeya imitator]